MAPLSFVALPFAALLALARPRSRREWLALGSAGGAAVALLAAPGQGSLDGLIRGWIVLVTVAFAAGAKFRPRAFWPLALRACLYGAVGVLLLVNVRAATGAVAAGAGRAPAVWTEVQWEATRSASRAVRYVVEVAPGLYPAFEPAVRLFALWPLWLVLETLAGLALAWRAHALIARTPLSPVVVLNP
ncbi:MAG TPA: hypothetical protein VGV12_01760 [Gemmatimonadales bacterium]|nr:hypothetical protein [Gemmatimonadales bacterium]